MDLGPTWLVGWNTLEGGVRSAETILGRLQDGEAVVSDLGPDDRRSGRPTSLWTVLCRGGGPENCHRAAMMIARCHRWAQKRAKGRGFNNSMQKVGALIK